MAKKKNIKIQLSKEFVILPLHNSQGGIRIADEHGNQVPKPTQAINEKSFYIEWMITNDEIEALSNSLLSDTYELIKEMQKINKFVADSEYSKRTTTKTDKKEIATFEGFKIYQYSDTFNSFEKTLDSGLKVRLTFKLGDFGVVSHPHMYVLIPFSYSSLKLKNKDGKVNQGNCLGSGCFGELILTAEDLKEIIITLSHASNNHRDSLIEVLK